MGDAPSYQPPPQDPMFPRQQAAAQASDNLATQQTAQLDTASLMARYGTMLAIAGTTGAAPVAPPAMPATLSPAQMMMPLFSSDAGGLGGF